MNEGSNSVIVIHDLYHCMNVLNECWTYNCTHVLQQTVPFTQIKHFLNKECYKKSNILFWFHGIEQHITKSMTSIQ